MPTFRTGRVTELISERTWPQPRLGESWPRRDGSGLRPGRSDRPGGVVGRRGGVQHDCGRTEPWHRGVVTSCTGTSRREFQRNGSDHIMKLRYTSLQVDAGTDELVHPEAADASLDGVLRWRARCTARMAVVAATIAAMCVEARIVRHDRWRSAAAGDVGPGGRPALGREGAARRRRGMPSAATWRRSALPGLGLASTCFADADRAGHGSGRGRNGTCSAPPRWRWRADSIWLARWEAPSVLAVRASDGDGRTR